MCMHVCLCLAPILTMPWSSTFSYNDVSPLENRSAFIAARALRSPCTNFVAQLSAPDLRRFRTIVCEAVLATDLTNKPLEKMHQVEWEAMVKAGCDLSNEDHRTQVLRTMLQCADIQSTTADFALFVRWGSRLFHEIRSFKPGFQAQDFAKMQAGFLEKVRVESCCCASW